MHAASFKVSRGIVYYARWSKARSARFRFEGQPYSEETVIPMRAFMPRNIAISPDDDIGGYAVFEEARLLLCRCYRSDLGSSLLCI